QDEYFDVVDCTNGRKLPSRVTQRKLAECCTGGEIDVTISRIALTFCCEFHTTGAHEVNTAEGLSYATNHGVCGIASQFHVAGQFINISVVEEFEDRCCLWIPW